MLYNGLGFVLWNKYLDIIQDKVYYFFCKKTTVVSWGRIILDIQNISNSVSPFTTHKFMKKKQTNITWK